MVLLTTLVVLSVLIALSASLAFSVRTETLLAGGEERRVQAQWLAETGLQRAVLDLRDRPETYLSLVPENTDGRPVVLHLDSTDEPGLTDEGSGFQVDGLDEASRLNLNETPESVLNTLLPNEPELVASILDWRDADDETRPDGAEGDYYATLDPPHAPRNAPFETTDELLLVKGVTPARFFGLLGLSPLADESERQQVDPNITPLANLFSIDTFESNLDATGQPRINLMTASRQQLMEALQGEITEADVSSIMEWARQSNDAPASGEDPNGVLIHEPVPAGQMPVVPDAPAPTPSQPEVGGALADDEGDAEAAPLPEGLTKAAAELVNVLGRDKLRAVYDRLTTSDAQSLFGLVNVNTASLEVLAALPGMDEATAQALVQAREQNPFETVGDLLGLTEVTNERFARVAPWLTTRGQAVRLEATGRVGEGREAVVRRVTAIVLLDWAQAAATEGETTADSQVGTDETSSTPQRTVRLVYHRVD